MYFTANEIKFDNDIFFFVKFYKKAAYILKLMETLWWLF